MRGCRQNIGMKYEQRARSQYCGPVNIREGGCLADPANKGRLQPDVALRPAKFCDWLTARHTAPRRVIDMITR
jgi:hypothetical protein